MRDNSDPNAASVRAVRMPLWLRSRARQFGRALDAIAPLPRWPGSLAALTFVSGAWLWGALLAGHGPSMVASLAEPVGLAAESVVITGQSETRESDVLAALDLAGQPSLVVFDTNAARERVLNLPWVKSAAIRKLYPGTLSVELTEKDPAAVWQRGERLTVVEENGKLIARFGIAELIDNRFAHLPHLVGEGAAREAATILPLAAQYPEIAQGATSYIRLGDRRWDIELASGVVIRLPEHGAAEALERVARLHAEERLLERQIASIDLRVPGRTVLQLSKEAAEAREELVSARLKAMKKADRKL